MLNIPPIIERITALLDQDTDQSVTYAALEARLALEKVCYDRLRQRHDYISHDQLKKWQPGQIVNTLMTDVDENVTETMTLMVGRNPDVKPEDDDFVEVGTEIGFDPKRISKMWQALAKLALHVRVPKNRDDAIADYGDKTAIRAKVEEVVEELRRLAKGTMTFSGIGMEVSFDCPACGEKNKRRAKLLRHGQQIHCINPNCKLTWKTEKQGEDFYFEPQTIDVNCESCRAECHLPWRYFMEMKHDEVGSFSCSCGHKNYVKWELAQVRPNSENEPAST